MNSRVSNSLGFLHIVATPRVWELEPKHQQNTSDTQGAYQAGETEYLIRQTMKGTREERSGSLEENHSKI